MSPILEVKGLEASYGDLTVLRGISFEVEQGGVATLLGANGAGKTTTLRAICGMIRRKGEITFDGERIDRLSTEAIVRRGIAHVPEDRQHEGLIMPYTAWENTAFGYHRDPAYSRGLLMDLAAIKKNAVAEIEKYDIRPPNPMLKTANFSGGNQQKIVLAREIERNPDILLVGQPTRGVDIGAIEFIHQQIVALRDQGKAILLVSVELDEILSLSDRVAVMFDGQIMGERLPAETNQTELGLLMAGVTEMPDKDKPLIKVVDEQLEAQKEREAARHGHN